MTTQTPSKTSVAMMLNGYVPVHLHGLSDASSSKWLYFWTKRLVDVGVAIALLLLCLPIMLFIALMIKLNSPGPVFFIHERVGARRRKINGQTLWKVTTFRLIKFRSMMQNADQTMHQEYIRKFCTEHQSTGNNAVFKLKQDQRITIVGRLLRRTSLDELPQLINVLRGEMSLIGPRPVPMYEVSHYRPAHFERLTTLPGITGLWQVKGRGRVPFEEMVKMDIEYARQCSLWMDLKILLLTVPAVLSTRGAA